MLMVHDTVAQKNFDPVLPPLPDNIDEDFDEESVKIVRLVKNKEPLVGDTPPPPPPPFPVPPRNLGRDPPGVFGGSDGSFVRPGPGPCPTFVRRVPLSLGSRYSLPPPWPRSSVQSITCRTVRGSSDHHALNWQTTVQGPKPAHGQIL